MRVEFEAKHIESAPKDQYIMLYCPRRGWRQGRWENQQHHKNPRPYWTTWDTLKSDERDDEPTHWATIEEMEPK